MSRLSLSVSDNGGEEHLICPSGSGNISPSRFLKRRKSLKPLVQGKKSGAHGRRKEEVTEEEEEGTEDEVKRRGDREGDRRRR